MTWSTPTLISLQFAFPPFCYLLSVENLVITSSVLVIQKVMGRSLCSNSTLLYNCYFKW